MFKETFAKIVPKPRRLLLCLEVNPPRGTEIDPIISRLDGNINGIDFFNVTDSALARMRFAPIPFASILKQKFKIEPLVNISCRDRNLIAIQGDLLAGWALGVQSIVALTGDAVSVGDSPDRKGVFEVNSVGLLKAITTLNSGRDISGNPLSGAPSIFSGVVVNPNARNIAGELRRLARKVEAGACYALSQPVFDEQRSVEFFSAAQAIGLPIFMGLLPFRSGKGLLSIAEIPGIRVPDHVLSIAQSNLDGDLREFSIEHCLKLAELNKELICGFHVISGAAPTLALGLSRKLAESISLWGGAK